MPTIYNGLSTVNPAVLAALNGRVYLVNDHDPVLAWNGVWQNMQPAGIAAPPSAPTTPSSGSGNVTTGIHRVRYRYVDDTAGYVSNPSDEILLIGNGANGWTFVVGTHLAVSSDAKVTHIALEATLSNGSVFYRVGLIPNTSGASVAYNVGDDVLMSGDAIEELHGSFGHGRPPLARVICAHRGRLFLGGAIDRSITAAFTNNSTTVTGTGFSQHWAGRTVQVSGETTAYRITASTATQLTLSRPYVGASGNKSATVRGAKDRLYWSLPMFPESFDIVRRQRTVLSGDEITALASYNNELWIFGSSSVDRLAYSLDPGIQEGVVVPVSRDRGAVSPMSVVHALDKLWALDGDGVYVLPEMRHVSAPIDTTISQVNWSLRDRFFGFYIPSEEVVCWFLGTANLGDIAIVYHVPSGRWWTESYLQPMRSYFIGSSPTGKTIVGFTDSDGRVWQRELGCSDGVELAQASFTTGSGCTTTVLQLSTGTAPSVGMWIQRTSTGERRMVTAASGTSITVNWAFSSAPASGETFWNGPIDWAYETKWIELAGGSEARRVYLHLQWRPASISSWCRVYFYRDFNTTAETLSMHDATHALPDGVRLGGGNVTSANHMSVDISKPTHSVPVPAEWARHWRVRLEHDDPRAEPRLLNIAITAHESPPWAAEA